LPTREEKAVIKRKKKASETLFMALNLFWADKNKPVPGFQETSWSNSISTREPHKNMIRCIPDATDNEGWI
jgi:hypothetical protein